MDEKKEKKDITPKPMDAEAWDPDRPVDKPAVENNDVAGEHNEAKAADFAKKVASTVEKATLGTYKSTKVFLDKIQPRFLINKLDGVIDRIRTQFPLESFEKVAEWFAKHGHTGIVLAQIVSPIFFIIAAAAMGVWQLVAAGIGVCALLIILQYTAEKFLKAGDALVKSSPSRLSSAAFLDCLALLLEVTGVMAIIYAIAQKQLAFFIVGLGTFALCDIFAYIALNPSLVNTSVGEEATAGEEAIGILSFAVKAMVRTVPMVFGIGAIAGAIALVVATISLIFTRDASGGIQALKFIIICSCLPFLSYIVFTLYHLTIDIIRAILVIPSKIDKLLEKK